MSGNTPTPSQPILPSKKGTVIAGGTSVFAPLIPWLWNMNYPDSPMTPEVAAAAAGAVVLVLGFVYNVIVALFKKAGINPEGDV